MVDKADIVRAGELVSEFQQVTAALELFAADGRIVQMSVAGPTGPWVQVDTREIPYPPEMVTGLRAAMQARQSAITQELASLGVTGTG